MHTIDDLIIPPPAEIEEQKPTTENMRIVVECSMPNPLNTRERLFGASILEANADTDVSTIIKEFQSINPSFSGYDFLLKYQNRLFKNGTVKQIGIENRKTVELVSLSSEKEAVKNEGFKLSYWSLIPLMFGISLLCGGLIGHFSFYIRGPFVLFGTLIVVPSLVALVLGLAELFPAETKTSFVGTDWFSPTCGSCCDKEDAVEDVELEEAPITQPMIDYDF